MRFLSQRSRACIIRYGEAILQLVIRGHGIHTTPALREYAEKKFQRLTRYFANIQKIEIHLDAQKIHDLDHKQAVKVTIALPGGEIHSEESGPDMYGLIDIMHDKMMRSVRRYKGRHFDKKHKAKIRRRTSSAYARL